MTTRRAIFNRWISILVYATLGSWFGAFAAILYYRLWETIFRLCPASLTALQPIFMNGTSVILLIALLRMSAIRFRHARYFWRYPPIWTAVIIVGTAGALAFLLTESSTISRASAYKIMLIPLLMWIIAGALLPFVYRQRRLKSRPETSVEYPPRKLEDFSTEELQAWLSDERAIDSTEQDLFAAQDRAARIWRTLTKHRSVANRQLLQTVVLEGPFGSGKTSVIRLLQNLINEQGAGKYMLVEVSAWGFSSVVARHYILNRIIEVLSEHVECLAVHDLPRQYVEALTETSKWFAVLKPSLTEVAPVVRLKRLLPILNALDIYLVVVIEDSDRNDVDFNPQHLQGMLNDFRDVDRLSFILTVGSASRVDFPKIAEQIESIPRLSRDQVLLIIDRVRDYCRENWKTVDPLVNEPE